MNIITEKKWENNLSKEEIIKLIIEAQNGSKKAKDKIIIQNIKLVIYEINKKFNNVEYDKEDLISIGIIGLIKAINTFNIEKGYKFSTYATKCIDNEILIVLKRNKKNKNTQSIESTISIDNNGNKLTLENIISDDIDIINKYEDKEEKEIINKIIETLPEKDKEIIILAFGFYDNKKYTQKEIATKLNVSQSSTCRLINKIILKIKKQLNEINTTKNDIYIQKENFKNKTNILNKSLNNKF